MKPTYPLLIGKNGQYIDYEISYELPSDLDNAHSVVIRLSYDTYENNAFGFVTYERNGDHEELGHLQITNEQFYRITTHAIRPEDKLTTLRNVKGNITIENGVATLPDGTAITL
jgi:hypothetical protein